MNIPQHKDGIKVALEQFLSSLPPSKVREYDSDGAVYMLWSENPQTITLVKVWQEIAKPKIWWRIDTRKQGREFFVTESRRGGE